MGQIYDAVKGLISSKMIGTAAVTLGEDESNVKSAVATILPALLGRMLADGITPHVIGIVDDAGKDKLVRELPEVFKGHGVVDGKNYGERMENALIGTRNSEFVAAIADKRHIKAENADRLTNWVSAVVAGYFGEQVIDNKKTMVALMQDLQKEKADLAADIPNDLYARLGVSRVFGTGAATTTQKKKGMSWIWWLIIILLLLILFFFLWRSCERKKDVTVMEVAGTEIVAVPNSARSNTNAAAINTNNVDNANNAAGSNTAARQDTLARERIERTLPDGQKITVYKNGSAAMILDFLNSDRYKNASAKDLKNTWFDFEDIDFVHDSPNQLTEGSMEHVNNLIAIMKSHKDVKMEIGGYADATGTRAVNFDISKERAEYIKSLFVKAGINANRISTEGFGKEFATVPANATDAQRAIDRSIAMRFTK